MKNLTIARNGEINISGRQRQVISYLILRRNQERVALLMIKVNLGIRMRRNGEDGEVVRRGGKRGERGILAISEMAVKINEWKSSLSLPLGRDTVNENQQATLQPMKRPASLHEQ